MNNIEIECTEKSSDQDDQYFVFKNTRIKITEHFEETGTKFEELVAGLVKSMHNKIA